MAGTFGNKSWFARKGTKKVLRSAVKDDSLSHSAFSGQSALFRTRTLEKLIISRSFDLKKHISRMLSSRKGNLRILDAGAGYLFLSSDIKNAFKKRVNITALSLASNISTEKTEGTIRASLSKLTSLGQGKSPQAQFLKERLALMGKFKKNMKRVNSYRVSLFENYSPKERYGLIIDVYGPATHSEFPERIVEQYANLLETNGKVFTTGKFGEIVSDSFGKKSSFAKQTGTYLVFAPVPGAGEINQIIKRIL